MKLYHLDRAGTLDVGKDIELEPLGKCCDEIKNSHLVELFPNGLSYHGLNYLNCTVHVKTGIDAYNWLNAVDVDSSLKESSSKMLELDSELIRRVMFPQCQSRYTALFAVKSIEDFSFWPELVLPSGDTSNVKIVEITVPDDLPRYDSNQLRGGVSFNILEKENRKGFYFGYMPTGTYDQAVKNWSGAASDSPRWEYLIPLPIPAANLRVVETQNSVLPSRRP